MPSASTMPRCGSCALWGVTSPYRRDISPSTSTRYRLCGAILHGVMQARDDGDDELVARGGCDEPVASLADPAFVEDGSGYYAALKTAEDFGCSMHRAKST